MVVAIIALSMGVVGVIGATNEFPCGCAPYFIRRPLFVLPVGVWRDVAAIYVRVAYNIDLPVVVMDDGLHILTVSGDLAAVVVDGEFTWSISDSTIMFGHRVELNVDCLAIVAEFG